MQAGKPPCMLQGRTDRVDGNEGWVGAKKAVHTHDSFEIAVKPLLGFRIFDNRLNNRSCAGQIG